MKTTKSCIILSQGPVPTPEHTKVEGGGLRCWGLARGIHDNNPDIDITVAYHQSYKKDHFTDAYEGISVTTWDIEDIAELIAGHDTVIVSYCMGPLSVKVADVIRPNQQLILDCNVPIYVEASARETDDMDREYRAFHDDVGRWGHVLRRGDVFLCASQAQKNYYKGVLSGIGRINPATYNDDLILIAPYGIYRDAPVATEKPIAKMLTKEDKDVKKILWFGGIYPWFDLRMLVDAVTLLNKELPAKLIIVGAKNPFNTHPDFLKTYDDLMDHINADPGRKATVLMQDWVEFEKRGDWYLDSDIVVVANKLGEENTLSWRTRLVDFMWADLPIITNGGDPLGEMLIAGGAAARMPNLKVDTIRKELLSTLKDAAQIKQLKTRLATFKKDFYWDVLTKPLTEAIVSHKRAEDLTQYGYYSIQQHMGGSKIRRVKNIASKARLVPVYAKKHGALSTYYIIRTKVKNRLASKLGRNRKEPGIVMVAHQLDSSGAPYVFMDLAEAVLNAVPNTPIEFHTFNPTAKENIRRLNKLGIKPNLHLVKDIAVPFVRGDVVVLNTAAHSHVLKYTLYAALEDNSVKQVLWFIHEDDPTMWFNPSERERVQKLIKKGKIVLFTAANKTLQNYQEFFGNTTNIRKQPYKYVIPEKFRKVREASDFQKLSFILTGTISDGRKGQLPILYAFGQFLDKYYKANPDKYRNFELVYVGMTNDFLSKQILTHASKLLGGRFVHHGRVSHEQSFGFMMKSNVTICYSLGECLPLFVFEGMAAGHPILRNDSSGMEEQLEPGKNGFYLDSADFNQVVGTLEEVLNKEKTTDKQLADMSKAANKLALDQANNSYDPIIGEILKDIKQ